MPQPPRRGRRSSDAVNVTTADRNVRHRSVAHTEIPRYVPRRTAGGAASFRPITGGPRKPFVLCLCRHNAIQQTNQFVLELALSTLQGPNEISRSLVAQVFQLSPQTRSALDQIQSLARMTAYSRTAQEHFLTACFKGPHSR